jgi:hypothetical protein
VVGAVELHVPRVDDVFGSEATLTDGHREVVSPPAGSAERRFRRSSG